MKQGFWVLSSILFFLIFLTFLIFTSDQALGQKYPHSLPRCADLLKSALNISEPLRISERESLMQAHRALQTSKWMPQAPQLRGRVDYETRSESSGEIESWSNRVGARLYLPSITSDPVENQELRISLDQLPDAWFKARKREEQAKLIDHHIMAREAWVVLKAVEEDVFMSEQRLAVARDLEQSGAISDYEFKQNKLKHQLALTELNQALDQWVSLNAMVYSLNGSHHLQSAHQDSAQNPLDQTCTVLFQSSLQLNELLKRPRSPSSQEVMLLHEINQQHITTVRRERRWFDFVEVSYDQRGVDTRWIAEIGIDLAPLDPKNDERKAKLTQLRSMLQQLSNTIIQFESKLHAQLSHTSLPNLPRSTLQRPQLIDSSILPELELYELEVKLWKNHWFRYLSIERMITHWQATHIE